MSKISTVRTFFNEPRPDTSVGVHETVLELLENEKTGRILDAGAGEGALTKRLMQLGFDVEACDLNPELFKLTTKECRKVDLNEALPYPSGSFDFVVCIETIEHLHDPWHIISEFKRVLRRHGKLIITTPNILSVLSRLRFLLYGEYSYFKYKELWREAVDIYHKLDKHINPISFPELEYILRNNNIILEKIGTNIYIYKRLPFPYAFIVMMIYPFLKVMMKKHFGKKSLVSSDELLCGDILIIKARKLDLSSR